MGRRGAPFSVSRGNEGLQPGYRHLEFIHQGVPFKASLDRIGDPGEVPELPRGARVERFPYGVWILGRLEIGKQREQIVEHIGGFDEDRLSWHTFDVVELFLFPDVPGIDLIEPAPLVLSDLEDQRQDLLAEGRPNALSAVGVGDIFQVVMEDSRCEYLVANPDPGEDAHGSGQVGNVGDPIWEKITDRAAAIIIGRIFSELVIVAAGGETHRSLEQRREQSPRRDFGVRVFR